MLKKIGVFRPDICPICGRPKGKKGIHLINLFHTYLNNPLDWYYMCSYCHNGIYHSIAGLEYKNKNKEIKPIPNLIKNLKKLETREEREKLLKEVILGNKLKNKKIKIKLS